MKLPTRVRVISSEANGKEESAKARERWDNGATVLLSLLLLVPLLIYRVILLLKPLPRQDFLIYWSAARLFVSGHDPYSISLLAAIERSVGWLDPVPLPMLYPPWVLPFFTPFAPLSFGVAHYLFFAVSFALEIVCSLALWDYFGGERRRRWIAIVILATFLPAASAEHYGQLTPLILAGMTGFLFALRWRRYVLAGTCLFVLSLKPHLLYLVVLAILLWSIQKKKWSVPISGCLAGGGALLATIAVDRNVWRSFRGTVHGSLGNPCGIGGFLRATFGVEHAWLQFVPCVVGLGWFAVYWMRHRRTWMWEERLPLLVLVSIGSAAYFWKHDYILGLPAVIALGIQVARTQIWPMAAFLYLAVQLIILSASDTVHECVLSLLWIVLYWSVDLLCVRRLGQSDRNANRLNRNPMPVAG